MKIEPVKLISVMISAAVDAGEVIMKYYESDFDSWKKEDSSPVTEADLASSDVILERLRREYPDFAILCEETADELDADGIPSRLKNSFCFIVDPLDGTRSFINHDGQFAVSIALAVDHKNIAGVVFAPVSNVLYYAYSGLGAYKTKIVKNVSHKPFSGEKINVSDRTEKLIAVQSRGKDDRAEDLITRNIERIAEVKRLSSCLKGCAIAEGMADLHYRFAPYTKEWDTAAEEVICREAGGVVTDAYGEKLQANREDYANLRGIRMLNRIESALE